MKHVAIRRTALLLLPLAGLSTTACFSVGRPFPAAEVRTIEIGHSTMSEIHQTFGEPWRTGLEDGQRTWTYGRYQYSLFGDARTRDLVVRFDDAGRVVSYSFNSSLPEDRNLEGP